MLGLRQAVAYKDHPRVCGEYVRRRRRLKRARGSPPRVRGIPWRQDYPAYSPGITPACAGNTHPGSHGPSGLWDHPRVCGEYGTRRIKPSLRTGSPPRVRGIRANDLNLGIRSRITPACAGNTTGATSPTMSGWDHPRVCGEYLVDLPPAPTTIGSPPRVRGIQALALMLFAAVRITPACAGNTDLTCDGARSGGDHPRVCGEYPNHA